jgi:hypothetical protein
MILCEMFKRIENGEWKKVGLLIAYTLNHVFTNNAFALHKQLYNPDSESDRKG